MSSALPVLLVGVLAACAAKAPGGFAGSAFDAGLDASPVEAGTDASARGPAGGFDETDAALDAPARPSACGEPSTPAGPEATLASTYAPHYRAFDLGPVPGVPGRLGGTVVRSDDPDVLLIAGDSEDPKGAIYAVRVKREPCGHIVGWEGTATKVASAPHVDANLVYGPSDLLFYTQWPVYKLSQLPKGAAQPARDIDLQGLGMTGGGAGGVGFVPSNLTAAGQMRAITWPDGLWYRVTLEPDGTLWNVTRLFSPGRLEHGPGGFAYVPAGSPGFARQSLILAEWSDNHVVTYDVNEQGDPDPATRAEFFTTFPRPWGAYFEPVTGDFLFLTWGADLAATGSDRVYIVQGFAKPPPPPPPPR